MEKVNDKIYYYLDGDNLNIDKVMKQYNNYIYTILNNSKLDLSAEDLEEILLDVYLTLWNNKEKLDVNKNMSSYIAGITRNLILKKARNNYQILNIDDYSDDLKDSISVEQNYLCSQENKLIMDELSKLKVQDKNIFISYYYDERKIKEIAIINNMSESKVKSKLFRIRKKIKKILKEGGYDFNG